MPRKFSSQALKAARQQKVSQLTLRGLTQREIVVALEKQRIVNPVTGKPWSLGTINADLKELEERWDDAAMDDRRKMKARVNAELEELRRAAWAEKDLKLVREVLKDKTALFNLAEPTVVQHKLEGQVGHTHQLTAGPDLSEMEPDEVDLLIQNLLIAAGVGPTAVVLEGEYEVFNDGDSQPD
jgi:hypothetical protein